jgi:hypothetical protein
MVAGDPIEVDREGGHADDVGQEDQGEVDAEDRCRIPVTWRSLLVGRCDLPEKSGESRFVDL